MVAAVAVGKWESRSDFQGRFLPGFSTAFYPPMMGHFSPFSRRGLGFPFHPSFSGLVLLLGSAAGLYLAVRWSYNKYPYLSYKHTHAVFAGEATMAAENARIEAEARELVKKRPYGPWLFR